METVSNLTTAATRAIFGDSTKEDEINSSHQEPLSGELGNVEAGEPYDKGNLENVENTDSTALGQSTTNNIGSDPDLVVSGDLDDLAAARGGEKKDRFQGAESATMEVVDGSKEHQRIQETKREIEEAAKISANNSSRQPLDENSSSNLVDAVAGDLDSNLPKHTPEGTGEKYVRSTGMKADGGDFDAATPGAAKEADRLIENTGVETSVGQQDKASEQDSATSDKEEVGKGSGGVKEKMSAMKEKLKAKLHKN